MGGFSAAGREPTGHDTRAPKHIGCERKEMGKKRKNIGNRRRAYRQKRLARLLLMTEALLIVTALIVLAGVKLWTKSKKASMPADTIAAETANAQSGNELGESSAEAEDSEQTEATAEAEAAAPVKFTPYCTESTKPSNYIQYTEVNVDGETLTDSTAYQSSSVIDFDKGSAYTGVEGIVTFRGNNFRDCPTYGTAEIENNIIEQVWSVNTGSISYNGATWSGSGWTGQPLMMKWPQEDKASMNMYEEAKAKEDLVEVIYACMDGYIYFLDLETGQATRDPMNLGFTFKGAGALDPRGYPIMYVGAGYDSNQGTARVFVINLLDCSVMYTFGNNDTFSLRGSLSYFDSSPLVDAETDTLIYPGENGILYLIRLNTNYDPEAGTLSINPDNIVKWHYYGNRTSTSSYWLGMEDSAAVYGGYLFIADNGGNLMCLDLNTLQLVWCQNTLDDSNSTPVLALEDGHLYLYVSTSFRLGWRSSTSAEVPIWKIDAQNGKIVWQTSYECYSESEVSGGVQSTIALGKEDLSDNLYVTVARTGGQYDGVLACLDRETGDIKWEHEAFYAWSSPVCIYNSDGSGRVLYCTCGGMAYLLDGNSGELLNNYEVSDGAIEASPAVYNDLLVVGTRDCHIYGLRLG